MKVQVGTITDFCRELAQEGRERVWNEAAWLRVDVDPVNECVNEVSFWATAVVGDQAGQHLLEFAAKAGVDADGDEAGMDVAEQWREELVRTCERLELAVRPGRIEV